MQVAKVERILLWIAAGAALIGVIVLAVVVSAELREVNRQLLALAGGGPPAGEVLLLEGAGPATPGPASTWGGQAQVGVAGVAVLSDTVAMTVTVRSYGTGDLLFEPPVLLDRDGQTYPIIGESLAAARMAFLDLVTQGEATAHLAFSGRVSSTSGLWLVLNPGQETTDAVAPRLQVPVPIER
jgi:hypothetical protein